VLLIVLSSTITGLAALYAHRKISTNDREAFVMAIDNGPVFESTLCAKTIYDGNKTKLYNDRDYHTSENVEPITGYTFCKTGRHNKTYWAIKILRETELYLLGTKGPNFAKAGWNKVAKKVYVDAPGLKLDSMFKKKFAPGVYIINSLPIPKAYPFSVTGLPIFWRAIDVAPLK
jgi:hypothetical protein